MSLTPEREKCIREKWIRNGYGEDLAVGDLLKEVDTLRSKLTEKEAEVERVKYPAPYSEMFHKMEIVGNAVKEGLGTRLINSWCSVIAEFQKLHVENAVMREALTLIKKWNFSTDGRKFAGNHKEVLKHVISDIVEPALSSTAVTDYQKRVEAMEKVVEVTRRFRDKFIPYCYRELCEHEEWEIHEALIALLPGEKK